VTTVISTEKS